MKASVNRKGQGRTMRSKLAALEGCLKKCGGSLGRIELSGNRIREHVSEFDVYGFVMNEPVSHFVLHELKAIGKESERMFGENFLDGECVNRHGIGKLFPEIDKHGLKRIVDIVEGDYFRAKFSDIWKIVVADLPPLLSAI